jgi:DNA processing protein
LITAQLANDYNREVMAVPGPLEAKYSLGCNRLIKAHQAHILSHPEDIIELLQWSSKPSFKDHEIPTMTEDEKRIFKTISESPEGLPIDEISWKTKIPLNKLAGILLGMELNGVVKSLPGKRYRKGLA